MSPSDSNVEVEPQTDITEAPRGIIGTVGHALQSIGTWTSRIFWREDSQKLLSPPVILLDMQRYEPKGLVGMTMRVLRRRFFNLWARPPPSWTNAVGQADADLPGTFVSRKKKRIPATAANNKEIPRDERSKFRRARDAVQSTFFSVTWPVRKLARGRLGRDYSVEINDNTDSNNDQKDGNTDAYLMQASSSTQLGIFSRRRIEDKEDEGTLFILI